MKKALFVIIILFIFVGEVSATVATGTVNMWSSSTIPSGYLLCDGRAVSRTTYANLYKIIGTTYGAGDGSTTFNLPNMGGKSVVGKSSTKSISSTGGSNTSTLTAANLPSHNHSIPALSGTAASAGAHQHYEDPAGTTAYMLTFSHGNVSEKWVDTSANTGFALTKQAGIMNGEKGVRLKWPQLELILIM
ncbi:MAG: phage tail protein [Bacilli bacterium]